MTQAPTLTFILAALLLIVVALVPLLLPLLRRRQPTAEAADSNALNLPIYRDQLAELSSERADGSLAAADFEQAERELKQRLLEDISPTGGADVAPTAPARKTAIALVLLLPLVAFGGYALLGVPQALDPAARVEKKITAEQVEQMVAKLADKLKANPDDAKGWLMFARSNKALGRFAEADDAFRHADKLLQLDADQLTAWAEVAARSANGQFAGAPEQLLKRALKLDPQAPQALMLAGAAAMQRGDKKTAADYWERILPLLEPGSEDEKMIKEAIDKARAGK
jgi:cytochrome c-type biogenesis protein CcmH